MSIKLNNKWLKIVFLWALCIALDIAGYIALKLPVDIMVTRQQKKIVSLADEIESVREFISDRNFKEMQERKEYLTGLMDRFVSRRLRAHECTYLISEIARKEGAADIAARQNWQKGFSPVINCQSLQSASVDLSCKGSYLQFLKLVNRYERNRPAVFIDRFSFEVNDNGSSKIDMSLSILVDSRIGQE